MAQKEITKFEEMSGFERIDKQMRKNNFNKVIDAVQQITEAVITFTQIVMKMLWNSFLPCLCMLSIAVLIIEMIAAPYIDYFWRELVLLIVLYVMLKWGDVNIGNFF